MGFDIKFPPIHVTSRPVTHGSHPQGLLEGLVASASAEREALARERAQLAAERGALDQERSRVQQVSFGAGAAWAAPLLHGEGPAWLAGCMHACGVRVAAMHGMYTPHLARAGNSRACMGTERRAHAHADAHGPAGAV
jgi:hypothetical protein